MPSVAKHLCNALNEFFSLNEHLFRFYEHVTMKVIVSANGVNLKAMHAKFSGIQNAIAVSSIHLRAHTMHFFLTFSVLLNAHMLRPCEIT